MQKKSDVNVSLSSNEYDLLLTMLKSHCEIYQSFNLPKSELAKAKFPQMEQLVAKLQHSC